MRSISPMKPQASASLLAVLAILASACITIRPVLADTAPAPTCQSLEDKCLKHVHVKQTAAPDSDGVDRPHMTETECYDSFHAAAGTGIWPAHVPFNFAVKCTS